MTSIQNEDQLKEVTETEAEGEKSKEKIDRTPNDSDMFHGDKILL